MSKSKDCSERVRTQTSVSADATFPTQLIVTRENLKTLGVQVSNSTLLRWEAVGRFPRRIRMGGTSVAWLASEIDEWIAARTEERARHHYADAKF